MCVNCGCSVAGEFTIYPSHNTHEHYHIEHDGQHSHRHSRGDGEHTHSHTHHNLPDSPATRQIEIAQSILSKNERLAERNRGFFMAKGLLVLNVLSAPGSGKTTLIERTLEEVHKLIPAATIVGDLATDNDAQRLRRTGAEAIQITTGETCHLEAAMINRAIQTLHLDGIKLLVIENVGNLVCPAAYDLGEDLRIIVFSVTEGEDKPLKYPTMFKIADVAIINKIDLAEAVGFDRATAIKNIQQIAPQAKILEVSARTGEGMDTWYDFLKAQSDSHNR